MKTQIYLDYNATAPLRPQARDAIFDILNMHGGALNASAVHGFGRQGRKIVETARTQVARLVNAPPNQVIFNSGATEGNNTVLRHFLTHFPNEKIAVSSTEHPSVLDVSPSFLKIPVDENGIITPAALDDFLKRNSGVCLVSIMLAHNETGSIQNVSELSKIIHGHGILFHCDATQAAGRIPIDITEMGIDFLTLSSHKIGGGQGVGALVLGLCGQTPTLLLGGGQEKSARAGTENVAGVAGFGAAAQAAQEQMHTYANLATLRDDMENKLRSLCPEIIIHAQNAARLPNTSFFSVPFASAHSMLMALDLEGIAVSNGSACSSGTVKPSKSLLAMGASDTIASSALRVSTGWDTKEDEINAFLDRFEKILQRLKK